MQSNDEVLHRMSSNMKVKFDKYWDIVKLNYLLLAAIFLDPRYKIEYFE